jgi:hypothetical protein
LILELPGTRKRLQNLNQTGISLFTMYTTDGTLTRLRSGKTRITRQRPKLFKPHFLVLSHPFHMTLNSKKNISSVLSGWLLCLLVVCSIVSCQKVISIDLNSTAVQTVVQGNLSNQPGPYSVLLSQTVNFSSPSTYPPVSGAQVIISDNAGNSDTLKENPAGTYSGSKLIGTPNRAYTLVINASGKNYTATSTMPPQVNIDSVTVGKSFFGKNLQASMSFKDPGITTNYYHIVEIINHVPQNQQIEVLSNELISGQEITVPIRSDKDSLRVGDSVTVLLQCIDKSVYTYYQSLQNANGSSQITPANPPSNLSNGALGYFSAYSVSSKSIVVP